MYQNYNYYPQQNQTTQQPTMPYYQARQTVPAGLKGRPVSSIDEAKASSIDFDGTIFYFPDLANKRIYTKQINVDGTATLNMYELKEIPVVEQVPSANNFVTRDEFEAVIGQIKSILAPVQQLENRPAAKEKQEIKSF